MSHSSGPKRVGEPSKGGGGIGSSKVEGGSASQNREICIRLGQNTEQNYYANLSQSPASNSTRIPPNLTFYVRIEPLSPDYGVHGQPIRHSETGDWLPPNRPNGLTNGQGPALLLRWVGGRIIIVPANDPVRGIDLDRYVYRAATIFTQNPDTPHVLAVPFDARTRSVHLFGRGWQHITFIHNRVGNSGNAYYSYISDQGAEQRIAASGSPRWISQLLPVWYNCDNAQHEARTQAGLIGELPLLFALAAFSAPPTSQVSLLNSIAPGAWIPHGQPTGHIAQRGMVVTIYTDPRNPHWSTPQLLDSLQNGEYGPFYGP